MTAASVALWTLLAGPRRPARVLEINTGTVFLGIDPLAAADSRDGRDYPGAVVALLPPEAVRLPIGIVLPPEAAERVPVSVAGSSVSRGEITIGWGAISLADGRWSVLDWWNPGVPELSLPARSITAEKDQAGGAEDLTQELSAGLAALASGAAESAVHQLLGVGGGLIPPGDDVLVGALAALAAWAPTSSARSALVRATATALAQVKPKALAATTGASASADRTTPVSAALLQSAATGFAVPEVIDYLTALSTPGSDADRAQARLAAITISSGPALIQGIHHQLQAIRS